MTQGHDQPAESNWKPYKLDRYAQDLVLDRRDLKDVLNESHKMRMAVGYGLERFWGEHIRLQRESQEKSTYWKAVWDTLADILTETGCSITLPKDQIGPNDTKKIKQISKSLWDLDIDQQRIALMVLTQFCDALVWWTQRYKKPSKKRED
jgi:hypothetical protein